MASPSSSFVNCTALGKNLGVQPLATLTEESPWEAAPGGIPREVISSIVLLQVRLTTVYMINPIPSWFLSD